MVNNRSACRRAMSGNSRDATAKYARTSAHRERLDRTIVLFTDAAKAVFMASLQKVSGSSGRRVDQPLEGGARPRFSHGALEPAGAVLVSKHDAHHVEHELSDIKVGAQVSLADGELDGAPELALQPSKVVAHRVTNRSGMVIELHRSGLHWAAVRQSAPRRPIEPVVEQRPQT